MRAATCRHYGSPDNLKIEDIERPVPGADEVLVAVQSTSVTSGDVRLRQFKGAGIFWLPMRLMFGILRPRNPVTGMEFAGRPPIGPVETGVAGFRIGTRLHNEPSSVGRAIHRRE